MTIQDHFFRADDEMEFKRQFAIQFLASRDVYKFDEGILSGHGIPKPDVHAAKALAIRAWKEWSKEIGVMK